MTEREIFFEALDRGSPAERAAFLDAACAGDAALRGRVEGLLRSHEGAGEFLNGSAPERLAGVPGVGGWEDETRTGPSGPDADEPLDFLDPSDTPGSLGRLGHYEVREVVGRGGMGAVLRAFDERLHRVVAIKVMPPALATSATARKRFVREARAQAAVTHDHVVTIHVVEESGRLPHIVMQFVAGQSLQDRLDRSGPLPLAEVLRIGMQAAAGLAAAHAQGLVHRDVKPANILLENGVERVKLTDFGLARAADDASLTQSGAVAGTPAFMSPEQAEGKPLDHRSDLFSLGSVLYAMCTGRPPFRSGSAMGVLKRVCEDTPTPVREANPEIPDWLAELIGRLHAKDPAGRFQSAAEVAELLGRHLARVQHPSVVPLPAGPPAEAPRPRRHRWAVAAAAVVATLAVLGATEAAGVTNVRSTVIRIFTPEGTLVVEMDDPAVKVTVEGDGDLVITGAGPQEVRLKAGSYRLKVTKHGKAVKLDRDLVAISRGDRQIVRVRLEGDAPAAVAPAAERGAFVLLGGKDVEVRKLDTLADAVLRANDGDTIEIRGNGPFAARPIQIRNRALTIRAATGFRPIVLWTRDESDKYLDLLNTNSDLVLEGLELRWDPAGA
ncbi:MAG: serine/threonine-protein kinase [Gemmataceae bacterium]